MQQTHIITVIIISSIHSKEKVVQFLAKIEKWGENYY